MTTDERSQLEMAVFSNDRRARVFTELASPTSSSEAQALKVRSGTSATPSPTETFRRLPQYAKVATPQLWTLPGMLASSRERQPKKA